MRLVQPDHMTVYKYQPSEYKALSCAIQYTTEEKHDVQGVPRELIETNGLLVWPGSI